MNETEERAKEKQKERNQPAPEPYQPNDQWKRLLYGVLLAGVYFGTLSVFKFWTAGIAWIIVLSIIGLLIFAGAPSEAASTATTAIIIVVVVGGAGWLFTISPYRTTAQGYYNSVLTALDKMSAALQDFTTQLDCINPKNAFLERCYNPAQGSTTQKTRKGLEISSLSAEPYVPVGKDARVFVSLKNEGDYDAAVKAAGIFAGEDKDLKTYPAAGIQCSECALGIIGEKIGKNSMRNLVSVISIPCKKISSYPYGFNMEYEYGVSASMPIDVLNAKDYDSKTADKETFLTQPAADSSSGPIQASIMAGAQGFQPLKSGTKTVLFAKLTNLGTGTFKLKNAKLTAPSKLSDCRLNGEVADDPENLIDASGRSYAKEKYISISCPMDVPNTEGQKRYIATVVASYYYNVTSAASADVDQAGFDACNAATSTPATPPTPGGTSGTQAAPSGPPAVPG